MILTGHDAIEVAEALGLTLNKYNDPTEAAREGLTPDEARKVAREDPSLIWMDAPRVVSEAGGHDEGYVCEMDHDGQMGEPACLVAWDSGVVTPFAITDALEAMVQ